MAGSDSRAFSSDRKMEWREGETHQASSGDKRMDSLSPPLYFSRRYLRPSCGVIVAHLDDLWIILHIDTAENVADAIRY